MNLPEQIKAQLDCLYRQAWQDGNMEIGHQDEDVEESKQALLEAFEQSLPDEKVTVVKVSTSEGDMLLHGNYTRDRLSEMQGWNAYRNEAIKVIRGDN